jgi:hypothetical protein
MILPHALGNAKNLILSAMSVLLSGGLKILPLRLVCNFDKLTKNSSALLASYLPRGAMAHIFFEWFYDWRSIFFGRVGKATMDSFSSANTTYRPIPIASAVSWNEERPPFGGVGRKSEPLSVFLKDNGTKKESFTF